ncbi:MAG: toll/interleukin-1 receptor domain-containing protein [Limisphaerales bacterium]
MKRLFISYGNEDLAVAKLVQTFLNGYFHGFAEFFLASTLEPGRDWMDRLKEQIRISDGGLFLLTRRSLDRPWVNIELGAFWFRGKKIFPLIAGELSMAEVHRPLTDFEATNLERPESVANLILELASLCGLRRRHQFATASFCRKIRGIVRPAAPLPTIKAVLQKISGKRPLMPVLLHRAAIKTEPPPFHVTLLHDCAMRLFGRLDDVGIIVTEVTHDKSSEFLVLEVRESHAIHSKTHDKMVKMVINHQVILPFLKSQRHWDDEQYVPRQNGFVIYRLKDLDLTGKIRIELVFWRMELNGLHVKLYFAPGKRNSAHKHCS